MLTGNPNPRLISEKNATLQDTVYRRLDFLSGRPTAKPNEGVRCLFVLDVRMPKTDGIDLPRRIKESRESHILQPTDDIHHAAAARQLKHLIVGPGAHRLPY